MRLLLVDDDADFRRLCRVALEAHGYAVEESGSAFGLVNRAAGSAGEREPVALILLDCRLPALPGGAALELLARDRRTAEVPVLLVSALPVDELERIAAVHPRATFFQKGGRLSALVRAVHAALGRGELPVTSIPDGAPVA